MPKGDIFRQEQREFRDEVTGARVTRLTSGADCKLILYFHDRPVTRDGRVIYMSDRTGAWQLYSVSIKSGDSVQLTDVSDMLAFRAILGAGERNLYHCSHRHVICTDIDTLEDRTIGELPQLANEGISVNCDETLLAVCGGGSHNKDGPIDMMTRTKTRHTNLIQILATDGSETYTLMKADVWLGHVQFSPSNPSLLSFCNEGIMFLVSQRMWMADAKERKFWPMGVQPDNDFISHEVFSRCGKYIIYQAVRDMVDCEGPDGAWNSGRHFVGIMSVDRTCHEKLYISPDRQNYGHYAPSNDPYTLVCDGEAYPDTISIVRCRDGVAEFTPVCRHNTDFWARPTTGGYVHPHPVFTPDDKYIVFNATMDGPADIYMVESSL